MEVTAAVHRAAARLVRGGARRGTWWRLGFRGGEVLQLGGGKGCDLDTPRGAPCCHFIGGKGPWVVQKPDPIFGRIPVGLGHPTPTRKLPPFLSPN